MDRIDELLLDWYEYSQGYGLPLGYGKAEPACRDFRISRQWMDYDDLDAEVEWQRKQAVGKVVEPMVQKLDLRGRVAVNTACRNFSDGFDIWSSMRVSDLEAEYECAKAFLCPLMVAAGLVDKNTCKLAESGVDFRSVVSSLA